MAPTASSSSCGPHAAAQPPPPIAQAPKPMGVISIPVLPNLAVCKVASYLGFEVLRISGSHVGKTPYPHPSKNQNLIHSEHHSQQHRKKQRGEARRRREGTRCPPGR